MELRTLLTATTADAGHSGPACICAGWAGETPACISSGLARHLHAYVLGWRDT